MVDLKKEQQKLITAREKLMRENSLAISTLEHWVEATHTRYVSLLFSSEFKLWYIGLIDASNSTHIRAYDKNFACAVISAISSYYKSLGVKVDEQLKQYRTESRDSNSSD